MRPLSRALLLGLLLAASSTLEAQTGGVYGLLLDSLLPAGAAAQVAGNSAATRVTLSYRRIAGATISLGSTGLRATTDSLGRFEFTAVPAGKHRIAYWDHWLEEVGLAALEGEINIVPDSSIGVIVATPSLTTYQRLHCGAALAEGESVPRGEIRTPDGAPIEGATIRARWREVRVEGRGTSERAVARTAASSESGAYALCGVPIGAEIDVEVLRDRTVQDGAPPDVSLVTMIAGPIVRRDVILGDAGMSVRLSGLVADSAGKAVSGASISVAGDSSAPAITDQAGGFSVLVRGTRSRQLVVRAIAHEPRIVDVDPTSARVDLGTISLRALAFGLDTVRVIDRGGLPDWRVEFERRRSLGAGSYITEEQLKQLARVTPHAISNLARRLRPTRRGMLQLQQGSGACWPRWYVDGSDWGTEPDDLIEPPATLLWRAKSIEVYSAAMAPPKFTDFDGCGVIIVWTR